MKEQTNRRFSITHTICNVGILVLLIVVLKMEGCLPIEGLFKLPTLLLVGGLPFLLLLGGYGRTFLEFIPDAFKTLFSTSGEPNPKFAEIAQFGSNCAIAAGMIGTVLGLISMLMNLENAASMGPAIASAFLAMLYGVLLSECFFAFLYRAYLSPAEESQPCDKKRLFTAFTGILLLLAAVLIMIYAMGVVTTNKTHSETRSHFVN